ncbi:alpha/beta fold hydrolase [Acrocarpospora catenulata]|uniref:alpha/beta fold hydrolase n=1 Tax=Acrocarpospora catenulata TaxID=2836182 RepID=UPI001BDA05B6|nr:alpha/beta hydrolase [Acrocarpospora catenulata]
MSRARVAVAALVAVLLALFSTGAAASTGGKDKKNQTPALTHGKVAVDGGYLHYVRAGSGPPLVLLHGWLGTWVTWQKVIPGLAREHTVIAIDLPGLGDSSHFSGGYDKVTTARRVREAVRKLGFKDKVEILAHDVGGQVAYPYARDFPNEVSRLAVVESVLPGFGQEDFYPYSWHFTFNIAPAPLAEKVIDNDDVKVVLDYFYDGARHPEAIARNDFYRAYADPDDRHAGYEYYRSLAADSADNQANAEAKRLTMPVLAMGGQYSLGGFIANSFRNVASDVREVVAPDAGHFTPEEAPGFTVDCARLFFGGIAPPQNLPANLAGCLP